MRCVQEHIDSVEGLLRPYHRVRRSRRPAFDDGVVNCREPLRAVAEMSDHRLGEVTGSQRRPPWPCDVIGRRPRLEGRQPGVVNRGGDVALTDVHQHHHRAEQ